MSARRFIVKGRDVRDRETGGALLCPDRATASATAQLLNAGARPDQWQWFTPVEPSAS